MKISTKINTKYIYTKLLTLTHQLIKLLPVLIKFRLYSAQNTILVVSCIAYLLILVRRLQHRLTKFSESSNILEIDNISLCKIIYLWTKRFSGQIMSSTNGTN